MTHRALWNPFANMATLGDEPLVLVRGRDSTVWDKDGTAYIDAIGSLWYANIGHGRPELADAAAKQMRELETFQTFEYYSTPPAEELAQRVAELSGVADARVFFTSGGSDAIDTAAKLSRAYWAALGQDKKHVIVGRTMAYHGVNAYGTSLTGIQAIAAQFGDLVPDVAHVQWDDPAALEEAIDKLGPERVAAFVCEPVMGAGGVLHPPEGYLAAVQAICRKYDVLFVADEVITGFGRLGTWFASQRFQLEPDMMVTAKGLTSGYAPLGAVIISPRVAEPFYAKGSELVFRHGYTYSGHSTACAVGLANIEILEREGLVDRVSELEPILERVLRPLESHPLVAEVRAGLGLLGAVELVPDMAPAPVALEARNRGVILRGIRGVALQISPPFVITEDELETVASVIGDSLDAVQ